MPQRRWLRLAVTGAVVVLAFAAVVIVLRPHAATERPAELAAPIVRDAAPPPPPPIATPARPRIAYVGSAKCGECHAKELAAWKPSWHARALAPAERPFVLGNFADAHFAGESSEAWMRRAGAACTMRANGPDGTLADFRVDWVIGGKRMQDDVTVFPDGRWQVLPVYFHVTDHTWVDYTETKQGPLTPEHPFYWTNARRMANHECLDCHTTNLHVAYDDSTRMWTTTFGDSGVACEDCHGPGGRHAETQDAADIVQPVHAGAIGLSACARCHGPRKPLWPLLDPDHQFAPGDSYDENYDPIVVALPGGGMSSDFFADGRPSTSSFEYQAMLQSACYRRGGATCLTCHTAPHAPGHRKAELRDDPDALCRGCHADLARTHSHHRAAAAQRCVACHMPPVVNGVLDHFADHAIDVPAPQTTASHQVPNACSVCHADRTPDDLARSLAGWWPSAAARQARRVQLADAFDPQAAKTSGPALVAVVADASEAPTLRGAAMLVLASRFGAKTAPALIPWLASPDLVLRAKACEALGAARATSAGDALAARLTDRSLRVRLAAALALFDLKDDRGEPALKALADAPATSHLMVPHLELGSALGRRGDFAGARRELSLVAALAPAYTDGLIDLAAVEAELGDFAAARARIAQILQLEPRNPGALALLAKIAKRAP